MYHAKFIHFLASSRFSHFIVIDLFVMIFEFSVVNSPEFCKISVTIPQSPKSFNFSDYACQMLIPFSISSEIFPFRVSVGRIVHFRSIAVTVSLDLTHYHCICYFPLSIFNINILSLPIMVTDNADFIFLLFPAVSSTGSMFNSFMLSY